MKKTVKWLVILAVLGAAGYWYYGKKTAKTEAAKPSYDVAKVEIRDLRRAALSLATDADDCGVLGEGVRKL
jgi:hypothetical protein